MRTWRMIDDRWTWGELFTFMVTLVVANVSVYLDIPDSPGYNYPSEDIWGRWDCIKIITTYICHITAVSPRVYICIWYILTRTRSRSRRGWRGGIFLIDFRHHPIISSDPPHHHHQLSTNSRNKDFSNDHSLDARVTAASACLTLSPITKTVWISH